MRRLLDSKGKPYFVEDTPFAVGGEGGVHRFTSANKEPSLRLKLVKIYSDHNKAQARRSKIRFMIDNPPGIPRQLSQLGIIWPEAELFDDSQIFTGFTMPLVNGSVELENLCSTVQFQDHRFLRFDHGKSGSILLRIKVAANLAAAVNALHESGSYVLVDLKPQNVLINPKGLLSLVDMDSMQINIPGQTSYCSKVVSDEFAPPEYQDKRVVPDQGNVPISWDCFSYAIIIYRLLLGIHPFMGSIKNNPNITIPDAIRYGYFVNGTNRSAFHVIPKPHEGFQLLPNSLQDYFIRTFDDGHREPEVRPVMREWHDMLSSLINSQGGVLARQNVIKYLPKNRGPKQAKPAHMAARKGQATVRGAGRQPVPPPPPPPLVVFYMVKNDIETTMPDGQIEVIGQSVDIFWDVKSAIWVQGNFKGSITAKGRMPHAGTVSFDVYETTTFWMKVKFNNGQKKRYYLTVQVHGHSINQPEKLTQVCSMATANYIGKTTSLVKPLTMNNNIPEISHPESLVPPSSATLTARMKQACRKFVFRNEMGGI